MLTSSLLAQPMLAMGRPSAKLSTPSVSMNFSRAALPASRGVGFSGLSAPSSKRHLVAVRAENNQENSGSMKKLQDSLRQHFQDFKEEVNEVKDQKIAPLKEGVSELKNWADEIKKTTQTAAPSFLKPSSAKNEAANAALAKSFMDAMDILSEGSQEKPSVLILDSKSPFFGLKSSASASVEILNDLPEKPIDAVVVDGLLNQPLTAVNEQVKQAKVLLPAQGKLVVLSQVNPDRSDASVAQYMTDLAKNAATGSLCKALAVGLEYHGFDIESNTQSDGVNTIIARKKDGVVAELSSNLNKTLEGGVDQASQRFQAIMDRVNGGNAPADDASKGTDSTS